MNITKWAEGCGLVASGLSYEPVASYCEQRNERLK